MTPDALERAASCFRKTFSERPQAIASAPGRVNLIGEHTDYAGGLVLPFAIDLRCAVAVSPAAHDRLELVASDLDEGVALDVTTLVSEEGERASRGWWRFVAAVAHELRDAGCSPRGARFAIASDVPMGAGLSSSAAFEVALATAMQVLWGCSLGPLKTAELCRQAEHRAVGVPCGSMDQIASVMGRAGHVLRIDCASLDVTPLPLRLPDDAWLMVIDSGVKRELADGEYAKRVAACEAARIAMGVEFLGRAAFADLERARPGLTDEQARCATHVITETDRVRKTVDAFARGDWPEAGRLLNASHDSLRDVYRVSCEELDVLVDAARTVPGVQGARLTGAGFGGNALVFGRGDAAAAARSIGAAFQHRFDRPPPSCLVSPSDGARLHSVT